MSDLIVSRIQNRRGKLVNLPQPLEPGELGWATDTQQLFIGADPLYTPIGVQVYSGVYSTAQSTMDNQIVQVDVILGFDIDSLRTSLAAEVLPELVLYDNVNTVHVGLTPAQAASPGTVIGIINAEPGVNSSQIGLNETIDQIGTFGQTFPNHTFASNVAAIMNLLSAPIPLATTLLNVEILTESANAVITEQIIPSLSYSLPVSGTFTDFPGALEYTTTDSESFIIEYSANLDDNTNQLSGLGTMSIVSSQQIADASLTNTFDEIRSGSVTGDLDFQAVFVPPSTVKVQYRNTLNTAVIVNITNRRWNTF